MGKFSRVSRRCDGIVDEFGAIWWTNRGLDWGRRSGCALRDGGASRKARKYENTKGKDVAKRVDGGSSGWVPRAEAHGY